MTDEQLQAEWDQITVAYKMRLAEHLSYHAGLMLFANFVNVGNELNKRSL